MRTTSKSCRCPLFRLKTGTDSIQWRGIWRDLDGATTRNVALTAEEIKKAAEAFEKAAAWLRNEGLAYIEAPVRAAAKKRLRWYKMPDSLRY